MISMRNPAKATLLVAVVLAGMLLLGVNAGSYRRAVWARGTVTVDSNQTVFELLSDCYDIPLFDLCTNEPIGTARDCVYNLVPAPPDCPGSMNTTVTSIFTIEGSTIAFRSFVSVVPVSVTESPSDFTHLTAALPPTTPVDGLGILEATGVFEGAEGTLRLSGAIDLASAPNQITFSCFFVIDVQTASGIIYEYTFQRAGSVALTQQVFLVLLITLVGLLITKTVGA